METDSEGISCGCAIIVVLGFFTFMCIIMTLFVEAYNYFIIGV
jgi:hypothetical protein